MRRFASALAATLLVSTMSSAFAATGRTAAPSTPMTKLCQEYWEGHLKANPTVGTSIGDRRYEDRLGDNSPAGIARDQKRLEGILARAQAMREPTLSAADRINRAALIEEVQDQLAQISCHLERWVVDPLNGPQVDFISLADYTVIETPKDAANFVARTKAMGPYLDQCIANLKAGLDAGQVASQASVTKTLDEMDHLLAQPVDEWGSMAPTKAEHSGWPAGARETFTTNLRAAVNESLKPGLVRYRDFLKQTILPKARPEDKAGLAALPGGIECYRKLIRMHTSLDKTPEELHQLGLDQVAKFRRDLSELGAKALGTSDIAEIQKKLRTDPAMQFATAEEVETKAREALGRAKATIPHYFGILPKADCQVKVMGMHEAPYSTIAYYREGTKDGSRPGYYMINTYKPETRPRYEAEALAFHESIPGHHLQIAIAQELTGIPEFRKFQGVTAFVEGWGLYSERLADDMGLYSSDVDRIGMLSYDAWRSCRLVVDTGMHAMGWSRQQAIDYMMENSCLAKNNVENEVDRYLVSPGQALAYKVGQLEILSLREEGRKRLGDRFDIKAFHDAVLRNGAVALPVLREQVEAYYAEAERAK